MSKDINEPAPSRTHKFFRFHNIYPRHLTTSPLVSDRSLFVFRIISLGYIFSILISNIVLYWENGEWFIYYTHLTYCLLAIYFGVVSWHSYKECYIKQRPSEESNESLQQNENKSNGHHITTFVLFEIVFKSAVFLDIVYWTLLFNPGDSSSEADYFFNTNVHLINGVFMLVELSLSRFFFIPSHVIFTLGYTIAFCIFALFFFWKTEKWVYGFLNVFGSLAGPLYVGVAAVDILIFFFGMGLVKIRDSVIRKVLGLQKQTADGYPIELVVVPQAAEITGAQGVLGSESERRELVPITSSQTNFMRLPEASSSLSDVAKESADPLSEAAP